MEVPGFAFEVGVRGAALVLAGPAEAWLDVGADAACKLALHKSDDELMTSSIIVESRT
jgi:hypothetical protein